MTTYTIELAEKTIEICNQFPKTRELCAQFLTQKPGEFFVETTPEDIAAERIHSIREAMYEGLTVFDLPAEELESTATYRKIAEQLLAHDITVFHGAVVAVEGEAYLFTAKSGTGKTTHVDLWLKNIPGAYIVNGDKPLLMIRDEQVYACGSPWAGKEGYGCNQIVPLKAICILERGAENRIVRMQRREAFPMLMQQIYRSPNQMDAVMQMAAEIGRLTKLYRLSCNMEPEAALVSYRGMNDDV